ncbi:histone acetyltransferase type B subunit, putative [Entamoeba invadens IP1]|uniref:Histone acetyltransferase type B subunit, putative n=1 Tax=Entamoeba invadens IP1 TaxID=370355 RepID=A0A0A1U8Z2_ENTIV|nr:histone acetyltransferase type B subunit, putative [Entamoeba invadens IP1]ELP88458.1 histone acetyltransferase type B subunit, putative [Entamoeba invadens IP1]|eukprot:XP_004255229.1 histone acetyltransferase type B subunit, putative [Entamoeba invadens IP1]
MTTDATNQYLKQKIWQSYAPYYYDVFINMATPTVSMAFDWLQSESSNTLYQQDFVIGSPHGNGVSVGRVLLPKESSVVKQTDYINGTIGYYDIPTGYEKVRLSKQIHIIDDVNRIRHIPNTSKVLLQSGGKQTSILDVESEKYDVVGKQTDEGFGLSLCESDANQFVTSTNDGFCFFWDLKMLKCSKVRVDKVNDVDWSSINSCIAAVTDRGEIVLIDEKSKNVTPVKVGSGMNCCSFSRLVTHVLATGDVDGIVKLWDIRTLERPLYTLTKHKDAINVIQFSPHLPNLLMAGSKDSTINIFNLAHVGTTKDVAFTHAGHSFDIMESRWNPDICGFVGSVAEEFNVHIWRSADVFN